MIENRSDSKKKDKKNSLARFKSVVSSLKNDPKAPGLQV